MRRALAVTTVMALALTMPPGLLAQGPVLDQRLARAQKVAVGFDTVLGFSAQPPTSEDRDARYALLSELESWGRYLVVSNPDQADLLIAIRTRWVVDGERGSTARDHHGLTFRGAGAIRADLLSVYDARYRKSGIALWRHSLVGGLSEDLPLLARLRSDVDRLDQKP